MNQIHTSQTLGDRRNAIIKRDAVLLGIGILYYLFVRITGVAIPCVFNITTGLKCPGCGITRAAMACARLDWSAAFKYNPYTSIVIPLVLAVVCRRDSRYVKRGDGRYTLAEQIFIYVCAVGAVVFAVLRNIL